MRSSLTISTTLAVHFLAGCTHHEHSVPSHSTLVLRYRDFWPQVAAYKLIGFEWYQWNPHGSSHTSESDDVKVVVYRNIPLDEVKRRYPVIRERRDYRYVSYDDALAYCDRLLGEEGDLLGHLRITKRKIISHLGRK